MFNVRLAGGHLYGKQLFTWLSLMVSLMASFVLSFFRWMPWMRSGTLLSQYLRDFLPTLQCSSAEMHTLLTEILWEVIESGPKGHLKQ